MLNANGAKDKQLIKNMINITIDIVLTSADCLPFSNFIAIDRTPVIDNDKKEVIVATKY